MAVVASGLVTSGLGCHGGTTILTELTEAGRLSADLRIQFNRASDASNRAVMADTDAASIGFAREAQHDKSLVRKEAAELAPHLRNLGKEAEIASLDGFGKHFAEYERLDTSILELAVENTNLKAQRLSFGPAREAADAFRDSLDALAAGASTSRERCEEGALVAKAVRAVREIQVLQAPHIAEADDAVMTKLESEMAALRATARDALKALQRQPDASRSRPLVAEAVAALDRFDALSADIVRLSRRNSNVRSLELSLTQKPAVTAACDASLRALQEALAKEVFTATR